MLELYVYYRSAPADADALRRAWTGLRDTLAAARPGLDARLLIRADDTSSPATLTWMEIYRHPPHGLAAASIESIDADAAATLGAWILGPRHREVFRATC